MGNELIFVIQIIGISLSTLIALRLGAHALVAFICMYCVLANLFVLKQITLFGLHATSADAFTIGATFGLNMLQEYYGPIITKRTIITNFFILMFFVVMSSIHLWYQPNLCDSMHMHFVPLLSHAPRIIVASFIVYFASQTLDYCLYGFLKRIWRTKWLIVRNGTSTAISQLFDTIAFSFLGLYGIVDHIGEIIIISYSIKILSIVLSSPFIALSRYFYRR